MTFRMTAPCHFGLEKTLSFEVKKIGGEDIQVSDGRVDFSGDERVLVRANMCLSTAERVAIVLAQFKARTFEELFQGVKNVAIEQYVGKFDKFPIKGFSLNSKLSSVPACQKIIKKAMVERMKSVYKIGFFQETDNLDQFRFSIMKDNVTFTLDTTGEGLHKRGYRRFSNAAPIKETLAAGIVDLARIRDRDIICDPFCGSGTLLIESAIKALGIPPCLNREFTAMSWDIIPKEIWDEEREKLREGIKKDVSFRAYGFDIDPEAVRLTRDNAEKAGVGEYITVECRDVRDFSCPEDVNCIICNPPYGERMLEQEEAREIYKIMGEKILPLGDKRMFVITPDEEFQNLFGEKADKNRKLYNGMLLCRLYSYLPLKK